MAIATGYLYDERVLAHDTGEALLELPAGGLLEPVEHSSSSSITRRTHALIAGSGLFDRLTRLPVQSATPADVALYHDPAYVAFIRDLCAAGGGDAADEAGSEGTPVVPASYQAALLAVGAGMGAVDAVMSGRVRNAFVLGRMPGHHAMDTHAMGFCLFNNAVIAARAARRDHGVGHIMIVDWDVHHGNGTQHAFYADPDTLFVSLHQEDWYPSGWGKAGDTGSGVGEGYTVNIPLPPGTGNRGYLEAVDRVIRPIARHFRPELILISAGQDASMSDPLGRMLVTMGGYRALTTALRDEAEHLCGGRLVVLQEGGYSGAYVPYCTLGIIEGLLGERSAVGDMHAGSSELESAEREYRPQQTAAIEAVVAVQRAYWPLPDLEVGTEEA